MRCLTAVVCLLACVPSVAVDSSGRDPTNLDDGSTPSIMGGPAAPPASPTPSTTSSGAAAATQSEVPSPAGKKSQSPEYIERFVKYYLEMYEKHLRSDDWIARVMGVISLARIDDPRCTQRIFEVMQKDKAIAVRLYAWEALHARQDRMTVEQRKEWVETCFDLARRNTMCGDIRVGLLGLIAEQGPMPANKEIFKKLFATTNSFDPGDIRTLQAMGRMLAEWKSPDLVQGLIAATSDINSAYRAEYLLRFVEGKSVPHSGTLAKFGSTFMWNKTQSNWNEWFSKANLTEIPVSQASRYEGLSKLMPRGEQIKDTADPQWRQDLELGRFYLNQLDVGFAIDSTGSMGPTLQWLQRDVGKMMRAFELVSREPRIGVLLYRDVGDEYVVKGIPLSSSSAQLGKQLREAAAKGGGDIPEAVYEGLENTVEKQPWSRQEGARKVVVLAGDAPPKEESLARIDELVNRAIGQGFIFYTIKVRARYRNVKNQPNYDPQMKTFDRIAQQGGGRSFWIDFEENKQASEGAIASPPNPQAPERVMLREVLNAAMGKNYLDRLDPFLNVLLQYVERPTSEVRQPFGPAPVHHEGGGPSRPHPPPKDAQDQ